MRFVLDLAVVIGKDRPAPDVGVRADIRVPDIGKVRGFRACAGGIGAAMFFALVVTLLFRPKDKNK